MAVREYTPHLGFLACEGLKFDTVCETNKVSGSIFVGDLRR